jgi:O-antigen/teichoic acid export membrane protein
VLKKLFTNSALYTIGQNLPAAISLLLLPKITTYLKDTDYAVYGIVLSVMGLTGAVKDLGLQINLVNYFFKAKGNEQRWRIFWTKIYGVLSLWSIAFTLLSIIILYLVTYTDIKEGFWKLALLIGVPMLFFDVTNMMGFRYYNSKQNVKYIFIATFTAGILGVFANYLAVVYFQMAYLSFFVTSFVVALALFLFYGIPFFFNLKIYPSFGIKRNQLKNFLKVSLPLIPHNYSSFLLDFSDRLVLKAYGVPSGQIGQYTFAYNFGRYFDMANVGVSYAVAPIQFSHFAENTQKAHSRIKSITFLVALTMIVLAANICVWLKELFSFFAKNNTEFRASYYIGIIIIMSYACKPMYSACINWLTFRDKTRYLWRITFIGGLINVVLNLVLVPKYGILASALATFLCMLFITFYGFYTSAYKQIIVEDYKPLYWIIFCCVGLLIAYLFKDATAIIKIGFSLSTFLGTALLVLKNKHKLIAA